MKTMMENTVLFIWVILLPIFIIFTPIANILYFVLWILAIGNENIETSFVFSFVTFCSGIVWITQLILFLT